jgi:hypothetical protein
LNTVDESFGEGCPPMTEWPDCSAHMGMAVMDIRKDLVVNAWYTGGVDVIKLHQSEEADGDRVV